jgi:predicted dehydrogenase
MNVEDNCFLTLETKKKQVAWLHASWSEWKNMFCFEIYGREGKLQIDGLGGSYGPEKLTYYKMRPEMGPPETYIWEFPQQDGSWNNEMADFVNSIETGTQPIGTAREALSVLEVVDKIYMETRR